ncbi:MFS transporter [Streptomyces botrytidirepellens]|uniref:MFS transporter n=1 Tax=Streptomyces botrytidirepellens TaxID=2486417 RepID=A0A3M8WDZ8_9ACTN|nr:MFS transporter [Streptomyces botrytidirepellens]RNG27777.1 MFS transporter [Streptomyces botrytidirepellens]
MAWGLVTVLRNRNARFYLTGVIVSGFGDSAMSLAAGVWVKELTGSSSLAALVSVCVWAPALMGPVIGTLADRVRRRPLLIATSLVLAAIMTAPLAVRSRDDVWLLFAVLTLVGVGAVLTDAAETALVASAVPGELRGDFNGLVRTAIESTKLLGPLAGAALFTVLGGPTVAALDAVTFALAALAFCLIRVREPAPTKRPVRNWWTETAVGLSCLWRHRTLRPLVLVGGCAMTASGLRSTATYALIDTGLHRPAALAGVIALVQGIGSVISGLTAGALLRRLSARRVSAIGLTICALGSLAWAIPWLPVVLGGSLAMGLGLPWPLISAMTSVQTETPGHLLGRVAASANTLIFAPTGLALLLGTAMVATLDYRVQLLSAAALALGAAALLVGTDFATRFKGPSNAGTGPSTDAASRTVARDDAGR